MKIALIIEHFDATRGGTEHLAVWIANQLTLRGHEVHVVCHDVTSRISRYRQATLRASHDADRSFRAHPPPEAPHDGLHIHRLRGMRLHTAMGFRLFGLRAAQWVRRHRPDVVHSFTVAYAGDIYHACAGVYAAMQDQAASSRPTKSAASFKRMMLRLPGKQRTLIALERRAVMGLGRTPAAAHIICICDMITRQFAAYFPPAALPAKKPHAHFVELSTPRIDIASSTPLADSPAATRAARAWFRAHYRLAESDRVALFVGHDFRRKGLRFAIEAVARAATGWKLLIVGMGKAREYVELADTLGIGDTAQLPTGPRVLFIGPTREMATLYAASDALLLPAYYEPSGLLVLEAFSHGLPIISTQFLGAHDLVTRHHAGTIVPAPRDVAALAAALDTLPRAGTPEQTALAARAKAASIGISPETYMEKLLNLYGQISSEKPPSRDPPSRNDNQSRDR